MGLRLSPRFCVNVHVRSDLCLQGQLVGYVDLSQLQSQLKLVFWVSGYSQGLLFEALHNARENIFILYILLRYLFWCKATEEVWICEHEKVKW